MTPTLLVLNALSAPHLVAVDTKAMNILTFPQMDSTVLLISPRHCRCVCPSGGPPPLRISQRCFLEGVSIVLLVSSSQKSQTLVVVQLVCCLIWGFESFQSSSRTRRPGGPAKDVQTPACLPATISYGASLFNQSQLVAVSGMSVVESSRPRPPRTRYQGYTWW